MINFHFFLKERGITSRFGFFFIVFLLGFGGNEDLGGHSFAQGAKVLFLDFELPNSPVEDALLRKRQISISNDGGVGGSSAIRVDYIGIEKGSERVVAAVPLKMMSNEMSLCYDVLFPAGFKFVKGGKLHGLGPKNPVTGGKPVKAAGWSARVGFRPKGGISTYIYNQDKKTKYGITKPASTFIFKPGRYHSISLHIKLNTSASEANGFVYLYVDGKQVVKSEKLKMRSTLHEESLIGTFLFSTFHGGSSIDYAPRTAKGKFTREHAYFDNISVYNGKHVREAQPGGAWNNKIKMKACAEHE